MNSILATLGFGLEQSGLNKVRNSLTEKPFYTGDDTNNILYTLPFMNNNL